MKILLRTHENSSSASARYTDGRDSDHIGVTDVMHDVVHNLCDALHDAYQDA